MVLTLQSVTGRPLPPRAPQATVLGYKPWGTFPGSLWSLASGIVHPPKFRGRERQRAGTATFSQRAVSHGLAVARGRLDWARSLNLLWERGSDSRAIGRAEFEKLIRAFEVARRWRWIPKLVSEMQRREVNPTTRCFNAAILASRHLEKPKRERTRHAVSLLQELQCSRLEANLYTYMAALSVFNSCGAWEHAVSTLGEMIRGGSFLDAGAFNVVLAACEKASRPTVGERCGAGAEPAAHAVRLWYLMRRRAVVPDTVSLDIMFRVCRSMPGGPVTFAQLYRDMDTFGVLPDAVTLEAMLDASVDAGFSRGATDMLARLWKHAHGLVRRPAGSAAASLTNGSGLPRCALSPGDVDRLALSMDVLHAHGRVGPASCGGGDTLQVAFRRMVVAPVSTRLRKLRDEGTPEGTVTRMRDPLLEAFWSLAPPATSQALRDLGPPPSSSSTAASSSLGWKAHAQRGVRRYWQGTYDGEVDVIAPLRPTSRVLLADVSSWFRHLPVREAAARQQRSHSQSARSLCRSRVVACRDRPGLRRLEQLLRPLPRLREAAGDAERHALMDALGDVLRQGRPAPGRRT